MFRDGRFLTLGEVFESLHLTAYDLSIDTLDMVRVDVACMSDMCCVMMTVVFDGSHCCCTFLCLVCLCACYCPHAHQGLGLGFTLLVSM